jgi:hypothetical protein
VKKAFSVLLLTILLFNLAGFYVFFGVQIYLHHEEVEKQLKELPKESLVKIILSNEEYRKARVEKNEISIKGKMYDVAYATIQKDRIIIYAQADEFEDELLALLDSIFATPIHKQQIPSQVLDYLSLVFVPASFHFNAPFYKKETTLTQYFFSAQECIKSNNIPPPKS